MWSVLEVGLVSPVGACARDHAFFVPASATPPWPSPFVHADGRPLELRHCPWIGGLDELPRRLVALGRAAADEALEALDAHQRRAVSLCLCLPAPTAALDADELDEVAQLLADATRLGAVRRVTGAAGAFAALQQDEEQGTAATLLLAVDSLASAAALAEAAATTPSPFAQAPLPAGEGAGALLVAQPAQAQQWGRASVGEIHFSQALAAPASDENDLPVDGAAMTALLARLPSGRPIGSSFGQTSVDELRLREWSYAVARQADRFDPSCWDVSLETAAGRLGAAAGVVSLAYGFACMRHQSVPLRALAPVPLVAWAISRDGLRGLALGQATPPPDPDDGAALPTEPLQPLRALRDRAHARAVYRLPLPLTAPRGEEPPGEEAAESYEPTEDDLAGLEPPADAIATPWPPLPTQGRPDPLVRFDPARARRIDRDGLYAEVVAHCADTIALLGRERATCPWRAAAELDERLLQQLDALVAAGPCALLELGDWWQRASDRPWASFACTLGALGFEGSDAVEAVADLLDQLPDDAVLHAQAVTEALGLSTHADVGPWLRRWLASARPLVRALGCELAGRRGELDEPKERALLDDPAPSVQQAAIRSCDGLPPERRGELVPILRARLARSHEPAVRFEAARLLALWSAAPIDEALREGLLDELDVARRLELYALVGADSDAPTVRELLAGALGPASLRAAARFGSPLVLPSLVGALADPDLTEPAAAALAVMCGELVPPEQRAAADAWRTALQLPPWGREPRIRRGQPRTAEVVLAECASGALDRTELALRTDELRAQLGSHELRSRPAVDLTGWHVDADLALVRLLAGTASAPPMP